MRRAFEEGIAWGDAKQKLFERIDAEVAPLREKYEALIARPAEIEAILREGARRVRAQHATPLLQRLRHAVGLRDLSQASASGETTVEKTSVPVFKQYREADGKFYFKLADGERVLLQSFGHETGRTAGQLVGRLKQGSGAALTFVEGELRLDGEAIGHLPDGVSPEDVTEALERLAQAS